MKDTFKITCDGQTRTYDESERAKMIKYFLEGMACCEGSERDRYTNIYINLIEGSKHAKDEWD